MSQQEEKKEENQDEFFSDNISLENAIKYLDDLNKELLTAQHKQEWMEPVELKAPGFNICAMFNWWKESMLTRWQLIFFFLCALSTIYILIEFTVVSENDGYTAAVWVTLGMVIVAVLHFKPLLGLRHEIDSTRDEYYKLRAQLNELDGDIRKTYESAKKSIEIYKIQQIAENELNGQIEELQTFQRNLEQYFQNDIKRSQQYQEKFTNIRTNLRKMLQNQEKQLFIELYLQFERRDNGKYRKGLNQEAFNIFVNDLPKDVQAKLKEAQITWQSSEKNEKGYIGYNEIIKLSDKFVQRRQSVI